ncbi:MULTISPECIES: SpoIIE family protein phosphatase [unclassified Streptomyces]|uniref:PP2C family protein-serine/threonine phosphatase n=1 Tax=unclassified Streptomyces TaxID=2593676 RepID=UPI00081E97C8|nr:MULTISPECIES: SpoIIE family protein phosphatase [unclassified Streptomyces]SCF37095.1 sigma-B regulation protein RsbU (phosphoserine phosphatase) [Streptomyces sp. LcepLS]
MCETDGVADGGGHGRGTSGDQVPEDEEARFSALLEDSAEDLYEHAPCGYLSTLLDGRIAKINTTLLDWLGYARDDLVGRKSFSDLLTVGGRLYHETHFAPLLRMQGEISGIALELKAADGTRLPVMVTSTVKKGGDGQPLLIRTTLFDARDRRAYETELLRARQEADRERDRLKLLNATLQKTLLPPVLVDVPGLDVAAYYHIASVDEVGGDFYDLFPLAAGTWGLFMGDVCGKGAAAAAVTSLARYTLRAAAVYDPDPAAVLANLNRVLNHEYNGTDPRFCTVVFGLLTADPRRGGFHVTLASGGHPPALLLRHDGTADYIPTPGGQLIGVLPDAHIATTNVHLAPGDTLLLHTDGLTEAHTATSPDGRYSDEALLDFGRDLAPSTASATVTAIRELLDTFGTGVDDDTAVLAVHVPRKGGEERQ